MRQHQLLIQARFRPEMLERVLRVVRHRGFLVSAMNMATATGINTGNMVLELTVVSPRSVDLLLSQLTKLMDVSSVEIQPLLSEQIRA